METPTYRRERRDARCATSAIEHLARSAKVDYVETMWREEKRRYSRVVLTQLIEVSLMHEKYIPAETVDISERGMLCRSNEPVEPLTPVFLMLRIPADEGEYKLKTDGIVMHSRKEGDACFFGIAFSSLSEKDKEAIRAYTASRSV
jgi:c-di-GMP-binding flagellar brake protein YcgR